MKIKLEEDEWKFILYMIHYTQNSLLLHDWDKKILNSLLEKLGENCNEIRMSKHVEVKDE